MFMDEQSYKRADADPHDFLMEIASFDSLIATAQDLAKPVFAINLAADTTFRGTVADTYQEKIDDILARFRKGGERIIHLIDEL